MCIMSALTHPNIYIHVHMHTNIHTSWLSTYTEPTHQSHDHQDVRSESESERHSESESERHSDMFCDEEDRLMWKQARKVCLSTHVTYVGVHYVLVHTHICTSYLVHMYAYSAHIMHVGIGCHCTVCICTYTYLKI